MGRKHFVAGVYHLRRLPPWGKLSPKVTDEGGDRLAQRGNRKTSLRRQLVAPLFYKERLGTKSPPHPPQCAHWGTFRPTDSPAEHACRVSPPAGGGKKIQSCFDRLRRPKHTSHPESASFAGAGRGVSPILGSPAQRVPKFLFFPARPAGGRAVTGVRYRAAGQSRNRKNSLISDQREGSRAERTSLRPGVLSSGFLPKKAGLPGAGLSYGALRPEVTSEAPTHRVPPSSEPARFQGDYTPQNRSFQNSLESLFRLEYTLFTDKHRKGR